MLLCEVQLDSVGWFHDLSWSLLMAYIHISLSSQLQQQQVSWIHHEINHVSNKTKISITLALCSHNSIILQLTWIVLFDNGKNIQENQVFFFFFLSFLP